MKLLVTLFLLLSAWPAHASAEWVRVESPHFVVYGEVGEKRTREYAAEFERFREALGRIVSSAAVPTAVPAVVFIFKDQRSFGPYRPTFNDKPVELSGYFSYDPGISFIMLAASDREAALRTIFHEYSHLIIANTARQLPLWANEGLAEYYSTFEIRPNGRQAILGRVILPHLQRLNDERLLPLEELLAVQRDSPLYNEGSRRSVFYSQAWALVHLLLNGDPDRTVPFKQYLQLTLSGTASVDAWKKVFGDAKVLDDLRRYVGRQVMRGYQFTFEQDIAPTQFTVTTPSPSDVQAALGDLRRLVTKDQVAAHIDAIPDPATPHALAVRGLLHVDEGRHAEALPLLTDAARASNDWLVSYRAATGLERVAGALGGDDARSAVSAALQALDNVQAAKPDLAHAFALRALLLGPGDEGIAAMRRARELAPGREYYAMWQGQFHLTRGEFNEARALIAPLMSPLNPPDVREYARSVMGSAVAAQQRRQERADRIAAGGDPAPSVQEQAAQAPGMVKHVFRELQAGEQRVEGAFERIECPRSGPVLHVRSGDRLLRFGIAKMESIEFITYRDDLTGAIGCGGRTPPDRVYVTFTPPAPGKDMDGTLVAVEFLPIQDHRK